MHRMRTSLLFPSLLVCFASLACGGNVSISQGGAGGDTSAGGGGASTTSTTAPDDFAACTGPGQCTLAVPGCCSSCEKPELGSLVAVNAEKAAAYFQFVCPEPTPCPACDPPSNPNLFAYCKAGTCVAADVRSEPFSECKADSDCRLRNTAECCETCLGDADSLIAVQTTAASAIMSLMCAPDAGCPKCLPQYPPEALAVCGADGHCAVEGVTP